MLKRKKCISVFLILLAFTQHMVCPTSSPITPKEIQQKILAIKRAATNLEAVLRRNNTSKQFYAAPQTAFQLKELHEAVRDLITGSKDFHSS